MIEKINFIIMCLFFICYFYQFIYIPVAIFAKEKKHAPTKKHKYAVLIAARNEEEVIGNLISSIKNQDYPSELVDIFVVADNCTDSTASVASAHGATVFERFDSNHVGKGYAINYLLKQIKNNTDNDHDAYIVFDADNVLQGDYITEINKTFSDGYEIITSYRNTKNFGDNWLSAGYGIYFMRESKYLNHARMKLNTSSVVSGTGFLFSRRIMEKHGGWNFFLLSEDTEFSIVNIIDGEKIGHCNSAVFFDEQPTGFMQSCRQRLRWSRGYIQVYAKYWKQMISGIFRGSFACYDMAMSIMPATLLTGVSITVNLAGAVSSFIAFGDGKALFYSLIPTLFGIYTTFFFMGLIATVTEWKQIYASTGKKILSVFTFPIFMLTYIPIVVVSLFKNPKWQPIKHSRSVSLDEIKSLSKKA